MTGALWAMASGIGFGIFQAFNRRAGRSFGIYLSTFVLLAVSALVLAIASVFTEDMGLLNGLAFAAYLNFALAGFIHFFIGWTFLNISQTKVGAARTGALVGAAPLFATFVAALALEEYLRLPILFGVLIVVAGVYLVSLSGRKLAELKTGTWHDSIYGLVVALCFSISPVFVRKGLEYLPSPLLGVTVGMGVSAIAYGIALLLKREWKQQGRISGDALFFQLVAGLLVGLSTWGRWLALDLAPVGVVLALGRLNVPVVILLSPMLVGRSQERVTLQVWLGALMIVAGSLLLTFSK